MSYVSVRPAVKLFKLTLISLPLLVTACSNSGSTPTASGSPGTVVPMAAGTIQVDATLGPAARMSGSYVTLLSNGATANLTVPMGVSGSYKLQLQAKGDLFQGSPIVEIRKGDVVLSKVTLTSATASLYNAGNVTVQPGDVLNVVFINDYKTGGYPNDRNALIDYAQFVPLDVSATSEPSSTGYRLEAESSLTGASLRSIDSTASGGQVALFLSNGAGVTWVAPADINSGTYNLIARVKEQSYQGDAQLAVRVNGATLHSVPVTDTDFRTLTLGSLNLKAGDVVESVFINDAYGGLSTADRNIYMDYFTIVPTASTISNPGTSTTPVKTNVRIMPLGDSITDGGSTGGYRPELKAKIAETGVVVDYVGSVTNGPGDDNQHEGHGGYTINQLVAGIDNWIDTANPDVVLLMVGTNDMYRNTDAEVAQAPARLGQLIDKIITRKQNIKIYVSTIPPIDDASYNARVNAYNAALPNIVNTRAIAGRNVMLANVGAQLATGDLADGTHPNVGGYTKMANAWFGILQNAFTR